jgi:hypothetical protein
MAKKILGQSLPTDTNEATLYTVPSGQEAVLSSLTVCNKSTNAAKFRVRVKVGGAGDDDKEWVYYDLEIQGNDTFVATVGITLAATDLIKVRTDTASALAFQAYGDERTG